MTSETSNMTSALMTLRDHLIGLERERCEAIATKNHTRLVELLSPDLQHTHTRGNTDTRDSYMTYVQEVLDIQKVERPALELHVHGGTAVMVGTQINTARLRQGDPRTARVESKIIQVWVRERDGEWRMRYFQATALGGPVFLEE
ncbi:nuclear transport factor 2 family protein [Pseudomonas sp. PB101]|uniref:nuclear transport factor 2 family protein n=1 Tax=Pseudomonas sp. PB101 TaxID=2495428 RepID=UPI001365BF3A|nr:nuclear transport factor 2 family protein [Pseudomonas sp. PB101]MVW84811.1 nuclear transport factor 2 family protein [Pseudomonas sp. PB101]